MKKKSYYIFFLLMTVCCREKYMPRISMPPTGYLVVEGMIDSGIGETNITLSRTNTISDDSLQHERGALVQIEGEDNSVYVLTDKGTGLYTSGTLHLNSSIRYRLRIKTTNGKEYLSDFVAAKITPAIDSVAWKYDEGDGVNISLNTHDPQNNTRYYTWYCDETWEFHSPFISYLKWDTIPGPTGIRVTVESAPADTTIQKCWPTGTATNVLIATTGKLSEDIINDFPLLHIPRGSVKISVMYSLLVRQYAISGDAYEFLLRMKKNTEQTGSVFDPQPSELKGNIHCVNNPDEQVIGFVSVASSETKRIFIKNDDLHHWGYQSSCRPDTVSEPPPGNFRIQAGHGFLPLDILGYYQGTVSTVSDAPRICIDCTLTGSNQRPPFWP